MKRRFVSLFLFAAVAFSLWAQTPQPTVPNMVKFSGTVSGAPAGTVGVIFAIYLDQTGGAPLWQEIQTVTVDASGHYTSLLGSNTTAGIPLDMFSSNEARWLGVQVQGQAEQARVLLVSVPYALKAADAQTLGGLPASAFLRADAATVATPSTTASSYTNTTAVKAAVADSSLTPVDDAGWASGYLTAFDSSGNLTNSALNQLVTPTTTYLGFNTPVPQFNLHFTSTVDPAAITIDGYGKVGINYVGRRADGTQANPTAVVAGDNLFSMNGRGWFQSANPTVTPSGFSASSRANVKIFAAEPAPTGWTDTAEGTYITMATTQIGTINTTEKFRITDAGNVGIGTTTPGGTPPSPLPPPVTLEVNGSVKLTHLSGGGITFQDGTTQTTAAGGNIAILGGTDTITGPATTGANALSVSSAASTASAIVGTATNASSSGISGVGVNGATGVTASSDSGTALYASSTSGLGLVVANSGANIYGPIENGNETLGAPPTTSCVNNACIPSTAQPAPYFGMVVRRVQSAQNTSPGTMAVVAYSQVDNTPVNNTPPGPPAGVSLQRDTTADAFYLVADSTLTPGIEISYSCQGVTNAGRANNVQGTVIFTGENLATPVPLYSTGISLLSFHCVFGRLAEGANMTDVTLTRYDTGHSTWVGTVISDTNQ